MLYNENMAFGVGAIALTDLAPSTEVYAGQSSTPVSTTATTAGALDIGKSTGVYKDQYYVRINLVEDIEVTGTLTYMTFNFYFPTTATGANSTTAKASMTVTKAMLEASKRTPIEISLPSNAGRFVRLGIEADATTVTAGSILATVEPTRW